MNFKIELPKNVCNIINILYENGYEAFAVGGCVRDSLLGKTPSDWDITTSAKPENIKHIFSPFYKIIDTGISHGTVTILIDKNSYEVTTYRIDGEYEDNRRPKQVVFTSLLKEDLCRRDFTINAMAYNHDTGLIDYHNGIENINNKFINTVGDADLRFQEDGLRMIRAVRFSSVLNFTMDDNVKASIKKNSILIRNISKERIREEFNKILLNNMPSYGIRQLSQVDLLQYIIPELLPQIDFDQRSKYHNLDLFNHTLKVLDEVPNNMILRLAALLHDIAKTNCFSIDNKGFGHFYGHEIEGELLSEIILKRLKYDNNTINRVKVLVRYHNLSKYKNQVAIRKFIASVGIDNLDALFQLVIADRKASASEYNNLNEILLLKKICRDIIQRGDPLCIKDLPIKGSDLLELGIPQGKFIGEVLNYLLSLVIENPKLNTKETLIELLYDYCKSKGHTI